VDDRDVADYWDGNAEVWTRHVRAGYDTFRRLYNNPAFFAFVGDLSGQYVLDVGCGEGYNTRLFSQRGARMVGIDISTGMIEAARAEEARQPMGIRYEVASMNDLSLFEDETFDACVSTMALMDCADYAGAVRDIHRVLRPGGLFAYNVCHPCFTYEIRDWDYDHDGECIGVRLGVYFQEGAYEEQWWFGAAPEDEKAATEPFTVLYFHRTLAEFVNPLCEAGFRIEEIAEPRPTDEACEQDPRLKKHQLVPQTLCVKGRKG
jgi:ubiquinone/menaquinone biosynthesis C-methylase UbiE